MTGRLEWIGTMPNCAPCMAWLSHPLMTEAVASVSIEHPVDMRRLVEAYHHNNHRTPQ